MDLCGPATKICRLAPFKYAMCLHARWFLCVVDVSNLRICKPIYVKCKQTNNFSTCVFSQVTTVNIDPCVVEIFAQMLSK